MFAKQSPLPASFTSGSSLFLQRVTAQCILSSGETRVNSVYPIFLLLSVLLLLILLHPSIGGPLSAVYYKQKEPKILKVTYKSKQIYAANTKAEVSSLIKLSFIDNNQITQISGQFQTLRRSMKEIRRVM